MDATNQIPPMRHRTTIVSRAAMSSFLGSVMILSSDRNFRHVWLFFRHGSFSRCSVKKSEKIVNFSSKTCGISFFSRGFNFNSNTYLLRGNSLVKLPKIFVKSASNNRGTGLPSKTAGAKILLVSRGKIPSVQFSMR